MLTSKPAAAEDAVLARIAAFPDEAMEKEVKKKVFDVEWAPPKEDARPRSTLTTRMNSDDSTLSLVRRGLFTCSVQTIFDRCSSLIQSSSSFLHWVS